jgi:hypothetical protein
MLGDGVGYRGSFNKLRPGADDGSNFHLMLGVRCLKLAFLRGVIKTASANQHI